MSNAIPGNSRCDHHHYHHHHHHHNYCETCVIAITVGSELSWWVRRQGSVELFSLSTTAGAAVSRRLWSHALNASWPYTLLSQSSRWITSSTSLMRPVCSRWWRLASNAAIRLSCCHWAADSNLRHTIWLIRALEVYLYTTMHYIDRRFTYLLTYLIYIYTVSQITLTFLFF